ncbi:MAG: GAF domain-containing protein [Alphaproteobacteria bacterium]|nr:GAF domain-containing protein [Alphaproteobacteria bacterium]
MAHSLSIDRTFESRWKLLDAARDRIAVVDSLDSLMEVIRSTARAVCSSDGVSFVLRDGELCHYADEDAIGPLWKGQRFPMTSCISGWCMLNGKTAAVADVFEDPRIPHDAYRRTFVKSLVMAPTGSDTPVAALGVYWRDKRHFSPREIETVEALAAAVGDAMKKCRKPSQSLTMC